MGQMRCMDTAFTQNFQPICIFKNHSHRNSLSKMVDLMSVQHEVYIYFCVIIFSLPLFNKNDNGIITT